MASQQSWDPRTTYRVRQLPSHLEDRLAAINLLIRLESSLGPVENIHMYPLASSASTWERRPSKTTTVMFKSLPCILDNDKNEWILPARNAGYEQNIIIDTHFLDFTIFNDVRADLHEFDCIAISGLSSHPFGSWRSHGADSSFMWLRDKLPYDMPNLRSMIYGYDTRLLLSTSTQTVDDIANMFINKLSSIGRTLLSAKPLVILAHSLGGIIVKRALVLLANAAETEQFILSSIKTVVFFGVPSRGMQISHLLPMVEGQPNENLVRLLAPGSPFLAKLEDQFNGISTLRHIRLISVYETGLSKTSQKSESGKWLRNGPSSLLVEPASAIAKGTKDPDQIPVDKDHSNLVKFAEDDHNYRAILPRLTTVERMGPLQSTNLSNSVTAQFKDAGVGNKLHGNLHKATEDCELKQKLQEMIESLKVEKSDDRLHDVREAYENTFQWIFEATAIDLTGWLQGHSGSIFWIQGKPGSGKSTLMKYILQDERTNELLFQRPDFGELIRISFFFHGRGSHLQKSFEGLYRSILYTILNKAPEFGALISPILVKDNKILRSSWRLLDLEAALMSLLNQKTFKTTIFLFLDALDEYDGPPEAIARFVKQVTGSKAGSAGKLQILFSSRSWTHFIDQFSECPGLRIQDYTVDDIRRYVTANLETEDFTTFLHPTDVGERTQALTKLTDSVVERASGVFLWVRLIVEEILRAATSQETSMSLVSITGESPFEQMLEIISSFPDEIEDLYRRTIDRLPDQALARLESYAMFEIVLRSFSPLDIFEFAAATACAMSRNLNHSSTCLVKADLPSERISPHILSSFIRKLKTRCGGLIEVSSSERGRVVQFMHQTVKDFVSDPSFRLGILGFSDDISTENGFSYLSKYTLTLLLNAHGSILTTSLPFERRDIQRESMAYAYLSELTTGRSQRTFLDSISEKNIREAYKYEIATFPRHLPYARDNRFHLTDMPINSVLSFAVASNLKLYVKQKLSEGTDPNQNSTISLLHCVSEVMASKICARDMFKIYRGRSHIHSDLNDIHSDSRDIHSDMSDMVDILLCSHADREQRFLDMTPFQMIFAMTYQGSGFSDITSSMQKVIEVFVHYGQDLNDDIIVQDVDSDISPSIICKPVHIADPLFLKFLLKHNSDVNGLDERGRTALDICYDMWTGTRGHGDPLKTHEIAMLLIDHGGCVTHYAHTWLEFFNGTRLELFLKWIRHSFEPDPRIISPPLLKKGLVHSAQQTDTSESRTASDRRRKRQKVSDSPLKRKT